jgi:hypothetical protein
METDVFPEYRMDWPSLLPSDSELAAKSEQANIKHASAAIRMINPRCSLVLAHGLPTSKLNPYGAMSPST